VEAVFLKSLTLKGFKSFADTTRLDLERGVTVVVGPNGSGKSNVVDAVAWVLGAQGPSTVRSGKMDDVIFAGTTKRPALGRAEVQLTLDNSSGLLPIDLTEVTISRTLYRSGDSEYALNGAACRLLDIQELLSDAGVGRNQHVIVAQGQIDDVLNARPGDRRLVVEEAAGILKFRKRKERAERRLAATESNLVRLGDLQREVRRQLRPLERQAEAARRHDALAAELRAVRLHLSGREIASQRARQAAVAADRAAATERERAARDALIRLDVEVAAAEASLAHSGDDLAELATRVESLRERGNGLAAVLVERRRTLRTELASQVAADVVSALVDEAARLREDHGRVEADLAALEPDRRGLAATEDSLRADRASLPTEEAALAEVARHAAQVRGEARGLARSVSRGEQELRAISERHEARLAEAEHLAAQAAGLRADLAGAEAAEAGHVQDCDEAAAAVARSADVLSTARETAAQARAEHRRWAARAEALAEALAGARAKAGLATLADVDGVVGLLAELVEIDDGWEKAAEAALGEALSAVVTRGADAARAVLTRLHDHDVAGAVLAMGGPPVIGGVAPVGRSVRDHVRAGEPDVERLLDHLVGGAVVAAGWSDAVDAVVAEPEAVVVTMAGDRFSPAGWRLGAATSGATRAALEESQAAAARSATATSQAEAAVRDAASVHAGSEQRLDATTARLHRHDREMSALAGDLSAAEARRGDELAVAAELAERAARLGTELDGDRGRLAELEALLASLEADEAMGRRAAAGSEQRRRDVDERARALGALRTELAAREAGLEERRRLLAERLAEVGRRLESLASARDDAAGRRRRVEQEVLVLDRLEAVVAAHGARLATMAAEVGEQRRRRSSLARHAADQLDRLRLRRAELDTELEDARAARAVCDVAETEVRLRLEAVSETVRIELDADPAVALVAPCPPLPDGASVAGHLRELQRELRRIGPVNPLALQEYEELSERHDFVAGQLEDVRRGRRELQKVIAGIDAEIVRVFTVAFADVAQNFEELFATLFPGGTGRLRLSEPDNLLESGIELEARPSGKNVGKLSLLSGGERSLTALAFLFAIFRSRPSPFYVLDEVEAALDDVNLHRFLSLVDEFRLEAQLVIVSHQKRTMEAADCLYGVSMQPGGSSKVVSERASEVDAA
jgi:chromosome segregation protein